MKKIRFNAPKGWYLFLTNGHVGEKRWAFVVSMPRRAGTSF